MQAKQQVAPLQTNEVANVRRKSAAFDVEQYNFRERFRQEAPFKYESEHPYRKLDEVSIFHLFLYFTKKFNTN
jgi:dynein heavy chain